MPPFARGRQMANEDQKRILLQPAHGLKPKAPGGKLGKTFEIREPGDASLAGF